MAKCNNYSIATIVSLSQDLDGDIVLVTDRPDEAQRILKILHDSCQQSEY